MRNTTGTRSQIDRTCNKSNVTGIVRLLDSSADISSFFGIWISLTEDHLKNSFSWYITQPCATIKSPELDPSNHRPLLTLRTSSRMSTLDTSTYETSTLSGSYSFTDTLKGVYYGPGCVKTALPKLLQTLGRTKALIVTGKSLSQKV